jgi:hypothetical protein
MRADHRADAATRNIEKIEVAMSIIGSAVASSEVRNRASRVAFPLMNCAMTAAAQHIVMNVDWDLDLMTLFSNASPGCNSRNHRRGSKVEG